VATHTHLHTGVPCNPTSPGPDCHEPGAVISCDKGTGLIGPVWVCVHEVPAAPHVTPSPQPPTPTTPGPAPGPSVPPPPPPKIHHDCETFDEGVERGFVFANAIDPKVGIAIRDARREATRNAETAGAAASAGHVCDSPCTKFDNVRVELWNPSIQKIGTGATATFSVTVIATWYLDILCAIVPEPGKGKPKKKGGAKKKHAKRDLPPKRRTRNAKMPAKRARSG